MKHESASVSFTDYREMIQQAQSRLPESVTVVLLADRGFVHTELMTGEGRASASSPHSWGR